MGLIEQNGGFRVTPVESLNTTRHIKNGHVGTELLPVVDLPNGMVLSAWIVPRKALRAWLKSPHALQLVQAQDGSMSMTVMPVGIIEDH